MTSEFKKQLQEALQDYFLAVELQNKTEAQRPALRPHFEKLDKLSSELQTEDDTRLRHFMTQKSYQKALEYLEAL